ncbi:MAG: HEPN domain-containing protein [Thermodesulfobacteriota bacterium]
MKAPTEEWLKAAKDDLDVIERIIDAAHLTHIVAFHAQQCIEKSFKALLEEHDIETPKIHNLVTLSGKVEPFIENEMDESLLKTLDLLYIGSRYPGDFGLLPDGKPSLQEAREFYSFAEKVYEIVKARLSS